MKPNIVFQFALAFLFLISTQTWATHADGSGGKDGGGERQKKDDASPPPAAAEGRGSAHGPNWDANWGWGSTPGGGEWGYGAATSRSPDGSGGSGFSFGWGGSSGGGGGVDGSEAVGYGGVGDWGDFLNAFGGGVSDGDPNTE